MTSDEERRRAVAELREASTGAYRHVDALDVIAGSIGVEVAGKFSHEIEEETYAALADLIDPTCEMVGSHEARVTCSACGAALVQPGYATLEGGHLVLRDLAYCPACGARVIGRGVE